MAWTVAKFQTVFGNERVIHLRCGADAATQTIDTGFSMINGVNYAPHSMGTNANFKIAINSNASGAISNGVLGLSGFSTGDDLTITVYGR